MDFNRVCSDAMKPICRFAIMPLTSMLISTPLCGCDDLRDKGSSSPPSETAIKAPQLAPPDNSVCPRTGIHLSIAPRTQTIYLGEMVNVAIALQNAGPKPVDVLKIPYAVKSLNLELALVGSRVGAIAPWGHDMPPAAPRADDWIRLAPSQSHVAELNILNAALLHPPVEDVYTLVATYKEGNVSVRSLPAQIDVVQIPNLAGKMSVQVAREAQAGTYKVRMDVGLVSGDAASGDLLAVQYTTEFGTDDFREDRPRPFRLGRISRKAKIEVGIIVPREDSRAGNVHILVTEPDNTQKHIVISLHPLRVLKSQSFPRLKVRMSAPDEAGNVRIEIDR